MRGAWKGIGWGRRRGPGQVPFVLPVVLVVTGVLCISHPGVAQSFRYSGALQYATGSYVFDARSHSLYLTSGLTLGLGRFEASASVPIILQNGGVVTTVGDRLLPTGGEGHGVVAHRRSGERIGTHGGMGPGGGGPLPESTIGFSETYRVRAGDPFVRGGGEVFSGPGRLRSIRVTAGAKIPVTGVDAGVGTGKWDTTLGASATAALGSVFLLGDVAYWWFGDLRDLELRDGVSYGLAAAGTTFDGRGILMASLSGAARLAKTLDPPVSLGTALGYRLEGAWSVNGGLSAGLTESAPDLSLFVGWSRALGHGG